MTTTKQEQGHTAGEWVAYRNASFWEVVQRIDDGRSLGTCPGIAHVWGIGDDDISNGPTAEANAKLIASAKDLLAALKEAARLLDIALNLNAFGINHNDAVDALAQASAAIEKATT